MVHKELREKRFALADVVSHYLNTGKSRRPAIVAHRSGNLEGNPLYVQALKDCLAVWTYLANHPYISDKQDMPQAMQALSARDECQCPMCTFFKTRAGCAKECPVRDGKITCISSGSDWRTWRWANSAERGKYALSIAGRLRVELHRVLEASTRADERPDVPDGNV